MTVEETTLPGVLRLRPERHHDARGYFEELWQQKRFVGFAEAGLPPAFVQDNLSRSARHVLRGLHFQHPRGQGKLVSVLTGAVFDVVVDVRRGASTFGRWMGERLGAAEGTQLYVPPGFAHGFVVLSEQALFHYKCTAYYAPTCERCIRWDDPDLGIDWPVEAPLVAEKDARAPRLRALPEAALPEAPARP